jgi:hypothetical protein
LGDIILGPLPANYKIVAALFLLQLPLGEKSL